jgi:hypothetical protein
MHTVIALQAINVNNNGQTIRLEPGKQYQLADELATDLIRAGYAAQQHRDVDRRTKSKPT